MSDCPTRSAPDGTERPSPPSRVGAFLLGICLSPVVLAVVYILGVASQGSGRLQLIAVAAGLGLALAAATAVWVLGSLLGSRGWPVAGMITGALLIVTALNVFVRVFRFEL